MFDINKRAQQRKQQERTIAQLKSEIRELHSSKLKARNAIRDINQTLNGTFTSSMFPIPGVLNEVKLLREQMNEQQRNMALIMDYWNMVFVDLKAKRIIDFKCAPERE